MRFDTHLPYLHFATDQVEAGADILMRDFYTRRADELNVGQKDDGSEITSTDIEITNIIVGAIGGMLNEKTIAEEADTVAPELEGYIASHGTLNAWVLDSVDHTRGYVESLLVNPNLEEGLPQRPPNPATISLGRLVGGVPQLGVLSSPILGGPTRMYAAQSGQGAFVSLSGSRPRRLRVDPSLQTGLVLVSENHHASTDYLASKGFTPVKIGGMAFKLLACVDPGAIGVHCMQLPAQTCELVRQQPVVGVLSHSAATHDIAAMWCVGPEAGAEVNNLAGDKRFPNAPGRQGIVMAVNPRIEDVLLEAVRAGE